MKKFLCLFAISILVLPPLAMSSAFAIVVQPSPPPAASPDTLITSLYSSDGVLPDYLEIYNQSDKPIDIGNWGLAITLKDVGSCNDGVTIGAQFLRPLAGWVLPKHYFLVQRNGDPQITGSFTLDTSPLAGCSNPWLDSLVFSRDKSTEQTLQFIDDHNAPINLTDVVAQHHQRNNSPNSTRTLSGTFTGDYKIISVDAGTPLYNDPLYQPPADTASLEIVEILPHARDCSPLEANVTCGDYVKFYNPTNQPINLAAYRLRVGAKGQAESVTNTFSWGQDLNPLQDELLLEPGKYFTLSVRNDTQQLSLSDSGNYVWLEDAYGSRIYSPVVQYPSASATSKIGAAWAYDGSSWRWTASPQPLGPNRFVALPATSSVSISSSPLTPCAADQYRNPATNRCKSLLVSSSGLTPCDPGQERNPNTNRCRSIATTTTALKPCPPGQERNPATNRCRQISAVKGDSIATVEDVTAPTKTQSHLQWLLAAGATTLALGYALYEWRQEIQLVFAKQKTTLQDKLLRFIRRH